MSLPRFVLKNAKLLAYESQVNTASGYPRAILVFAGDDENGKRVILLGRACIGSNLSFRYRDFMAQCPDIVYYYNSKGRCIFERWVASGEVK